MTVWLVLACVVVVNGAAVTAWGLWLRRKVLERPTVRASIEPNGAGYRWHVEVQLPPVVFLGSAATHREAEEFVGQALLRAVERALDEASESAAEELGC